MAKRELQVRLSVPEALTELRQRPEVADDGPFAVRTSSDRAVVSLRRARPPFEDYELAPQELHVRLTARGRDTVVAARIRLRASWRGISGSLLLGLTHFGANWLADAGDWRDIAKRRAADRADLLALLTATYGPHEVPSGHDPFRAP